MGIFLFWPKKCAKNKKILQRKGHMFLFKNFDTVDVLAFIELYKKKFSVFENGQIRTKCHFQINYFRVHIAFESKEIHSFWFENEISLESHKINWKATETLALVEYKLGFYGRRSGFCRFRLKTCTDFYNTCILIVLIIIYIQKFLCCLAYNAARYSTTTSVYDEATVTFNFGQVKTVSLLV